MLLKVSTKWVAKEETSMRDERSEAWYLEVGAVFEGRRAAMEDGSKMRKVSTNANVVEYRHLKNESWNKKKMKKLEKMI